MNNNINSFISKARNKSEVAEYYGISVRTLNNWIKTSGLDIEPVGNLYSPAQLKIIVEHFGDNEK